MICGVVPLVLFDFTTTITNARKKEQKNIYMQKNLVLSHYNNVLSTKDTRNVLE